MAWTSSFVINPHGSIFGPFAEPAVVSDFWQLAKGANRPIEKTSARRRVFDARSEAIIEINSLVFRPQDARQPNRSAKRPAPPKINNTGRMHGGEKPERKAARASCRTWRSPSTQKIVEPGRNRSRQKWRRRKR